MRLLIIASLFAISAQSQEFSRKDSLQGGLRPERTSYDVRRYDLDIRIDPDKRHISGFNDLTVEFITPSPEIQIDLFENMQVDSIVMEGKPLAYRREFGAVFVQTQYATGNKIIRFYYSGHPLAAKRAPWDGGFDFKKDREGNHWIGVAVQGTGASLWYPCKDSQTDEPDLGASIKVAVPNGLMNVSNGRLLGSKDLGDGYTRWDWEVKNPINNYNITVNIANYSHIHEQHNGLDLDYYVLHYNEQKAREHFAEVKPMMDCFQEKFGPYPFASDGFKLVETPYLGMEHQSAVAYGNRYMKGYLGYDISGSGVGMRFDYIIIHETGHEWFGNSVTSADIADMWIHEGFTTYSETVFAECRWGYADAMRYINGEKNSIANDRPVIGCFGVNHEGSGDMYYKGAVMLNTMRHIVADDRKWWSMLRRFAETYRHKIIDTPTVLQFFNTESGLSFDKVFEQYLKTTKIPTLVLSSDGNSFNYHWANAVDGFDMPVEVELRGKTVRLNPTSQPKRFRQKADLASVKVLTDKFLVKAEKR